MLSWHLGFYQGMEFVPFPSAAQEGSCLGPWGRAPFLLISPPLTLGSQAGMCPSSAVNPSSVTLQKRAVLASDPRTGQTNHGGALTLHWVCFVGLGCACMHVSVCVCVHVLCLQAWYHPIKSCTFLIGFFSLLFPDVITSSWTVVSRMTHLNWQCQPTPCICARSIIVLIAFGLVRCVALPLCLSFLSHLMTSHTVHFTAQFLCL